MLPPVIHYACQSGGEKRLFQAFKNSTDTENWVVLHSVGIAKHLRRMAGEIDFVIIVPDSGIICVEVKAGNVSCYNGIWHYPYGKSSRSPFAQCMDSMHSLRSFIARDNPSLSSLLLTSAVFFTDVDVLVENPEWHHWQNIGISKLGGVAFPYLSRVCRNILGNAHRDTAETSSALWYDSKLSRPDNDQALALTELLRPEFEFYVSAKHKIDTVDYEIMRFTREQFSALDMIKNYPRAGFQGPASTGKTLLALESVRREVANDRNTAIFCYNRALGHWLQTETSAIRESDEGNRLQWAGTFLSYLQHLLSEPVPTDPKLEYWTQELPQKITDKMLKGDIPSNQLDSFVLDEAQDFRNEYWLNALDLLLVGGLSDGRWFYFGDFLRQSIYGMEESSEHWQTGTKTMPPELALNINCRNSDVIRNYIERISAMNPPYDRALNEIQGPPPRLTFFNDGITQKNMLIQLLTSLHEEGYPMRSVVILSPKANASCALQLSENSKFPLLSFESTMRDHAIRFTTIQAFKGLESPTIIITDISTIQGEHAQSLLYIAMSRARQQLFIFLGETTRDSLRQIISP